MRKAQFVATVSVLAACAVLAPVTILIENVAAIHDVNAYKDARHDLEMAALDDVGDHDGEGEYFTRKDGTLMSEASIYWLCDTMGNLKCGY